MDTPFPHAIALRGPQGQIIWADPQQMPYIPNPQIMTETEVAAARMLALVTSKQPAAKAETPPPMGEPKKKAGWPKGKPRK